MTAGAGHLGDRLAALVDGQLGHADRDRVLAHLTRCASCRHEAADQRALKARLDHLDVRAPGGLESRLLALPERPGALPTGVPVTPVTAPPPPVAASASRRRPPPAALGVLLLVGIGVGAVVPALDHGAPAPRRDPGKAGLVVEHATATTHVPLGDPGVVGAAWSAVPHVRPLLPAPTVPAGAVTPPPVPGAVTPPPVPGAVTPPPVPGAVTPPAVRWSGAGPGSGPSTGVVAPLGTTAARGR